MSAIYIRLLGPFRLEFDGRQLAVSAARQRALLSYLSRQPGQVGRDRLATLLWGDKVDHQARQSLRQLLLEAHGDLQVQGIKVIRADRVSVDLDRSRLEVDVDRFFRLAGSNGLIELKEAVDLYSGHFLEGLFLQSEAFDEWAEAERVGLKLKAAEVFQRLALLYSSGGRGTDAIHIAERLVSLDPLDESSQRLLIRQLTTHRGADIAYKRLMAFVSRLADEFGAKPEFETESLLREIGEGKAAQTKTLNELAAAKRGSRASLTPVDGGERKIVTVLSARVAEPVELFASRDLEDGQALINPVISNMIEAVQHYNGTVSQMTNSGIMALFGAPIAHEDHAVYACYAALRMQAATMRDRRNDAVINTEPLSIRIGIHTGEVIAQSIASGPRIDYVATGLTTELAVQLEQVADPGATLLTSATFSLAERYVKTQAKPPLQIRGLSAPLEIRLLTGMDNARAGLEGAMAHGLTPFTGRHRQLDFLRRALRRVEHGQGSVVAIVGDPGIGKSRLCWELLHSKEAAKWTVLQSRANSYNQRSPLRPFIDLLKANFGIESHDHARRIREKIESRIKSDEPSVTSDFPALCSFLDISVQDATWDQLPPAQRLRRIMDAVKGALVGTARARPTLLLIEDLHWIDAETQALLDEMVDSLPGHMLLLVSYRPEYRHSWAGKKRFQTVRVPPLTAAGSGKLMDSLIGSHASLGQLKRFLMPRAGGNPLFLEQSIRSLLENGLLVDRLGDYRLNRSFGDAPSAPTPTVQAIIASRIDRLPAMDKRLLQAAAVIGRDVPLASLQSIADLTAAELDGAIARLEAADFLRRTRVRNPVFAFKHDLIHEVVYGSLVQDRRMDLHARVMPVTERLYAERLEEHLDVLAWHALKGKLWGEAVRYLRRAASKDLLRSLYRSAKASLELAISALTHLPASADNKELGLALRLEMRLALLPLGEQDNLEKILLEAYAIGKELEDVEWIGRISNFLTSIHITKGDHVRGLALGTDASCQSGDAGVKALGLTLTATCHQALGRHGAAVHLFREATACVSGPLARYRFDQVVLPSVLARGGLAISLAEIGAFDEALKVGEEGLRLAEEGTAAVDLALALMGIGRPYLRRGDISKAEPLFERAVHICRTFEISHYLVSVAPALGATQILAGRPGLAIDLLQPVKELAEKRSMFSVYAFTVATLSEAMFREGDEDRAFDLAELALNFARTRQHRGFEAWTLRLLGEITMRRKIVDLDVSNALFTEALSTANECGMWPLIAHCHQGLSNVFYRSRSLSEARSHQHIAANLYRRFGMQFFAMATGNGDRG